MSTTSPHTLTDASRFNLEAAARRIFDRLPIQRGSMFGLIILGALIAFEVFNYSTTEFALADLLGDLRFWDIRWSTILALAFCSMDFAGIARLFTPERGKNEPIGVWYLLGAWFLAATMNAILSWWAVSLALLSHRGLGNELVGREALLSGVPIFVAILVWLIRVLIIGAFTLNGERLFSQGKARPLLHTRKSRSSLTNQRSNVPNRPASARRPVHPVPKPVTRREPTYSPQQLSAKPPTRN